MKTLEEFLTPHCNAENLDKFVVRGTVLQALQETQQLFSGRYWTLVVVTCPTSLWCYPPNRVMKWGT